MNISQKAIEKYKNKFFINGFSTFFPIKRKYEAAIVVPAIAELEGIKNLLKSLSYNDSTLLRETLILFVINNSTESDKNIKNKNLDTINFLCNIIVKKENLFSNDLNINFVDATNSLTQNVAGVGIARKIGMDISLTALNYFSKNKKLIISLDADCIVERNYLTEIFSYMTKHNAEAAVIDF